jgi:predicted transcriptional regulator
MKISFLALCFLLIIIVLQLLPVEVNGQGELEWKASIKITVETDGSASWIVERKTDLQNESDKAAFFDYANLTSVESFAENMKSQVSYASLITGRSMRAENFQVIVNIFRIPTGLEGVIQFQFEWVGFAKNMDNQGIKIGDVFVGELDLSKDDTLVIYYPVDYDVEFVYPLPDETGKSDRALIWYGPKNFGAGEPIIFLKKEEFDFFKIFDFKLLISIITITCLSVACLWLYIERRKYSVEQASKPSRFQIKSDEENVIAMLKEAGGSMPQSAITKKCGFSKSKMSGLLKSMEERGVIKRRRKGREKVVMLITENEQ